MKKLTIEFVKEQFEKEEYKGTTLKDLEEGGINKWMPHIRR